MTDTGDLVFSGDHLRATIFRPLEPRLAVTFSFRENGRTDFSPVHPIKHLADRGFAQLSITTRRNDWFINPDTAALEDVLRSLAPVYRAVHMLGYSMGGYGVFRFARAIGAHYATAVSPQFSIHPDVVPHDKRFHDDAAGFDRVAGDLVKVRKPGLQGVIVVDPFRRNDLMNANMIRDVFPRMAIARLGFGGHPATGLLRRAQKSGVIQRTAFEAPPRAAPIIAAHRSARADDADYGADALKRMMKRTRQSD